MYHLDPINKTASKVVNQKGCDQGLLKSERLEESIRRLDWLYVLLKRYPKHSKNYKKTRKEIAEVKSEIQELESNLDGLYSKSRPIEMYLVDQVKSMLNDHQFKSIMSMAEQEKSRNDEKVDIKRKKL